MYRRVFNVTRWDGRKADCVLMPDNTAREIVGPVLVDKPVRTLHFATFRQNIREIVALRDSVLT